MLKSIVCVAEDWGIGKNNGLLFNIPEDMQHFKNLTMNNIVVMGYNTLLSLPNSKPLKDRINVVLCPKGVEPEGCIVYHDFDKLMKDLKITAANQDIYIIGGAMLYKTTVDYIDEAIVTKVNATDKEVTVYFPNLDQDTRFTAELLETKKSISGYTISIYSYRREGIHA